MVAFPDRQDILGTIEDMLERGQPVIVPSETMGMLMKDFGKSLTGILLAMVEDNDTPIASVAGRRLVWAAPKSWSKDRLDAFINKHRAQLTKWFGGIRDMTEEEKQQMFEEHKRYQEEQGEGSDG